jgi:hypothetical protein
MMDYRFEKFDLNHIEKMIVIANPLDSKNKRKNKERYIRIAFESLEDFLAKDNRKNYIYILIQGTSQELNPIVLAIKNSNFDLADKLLKELIEDISMRIYKLEGGINSYETRIEDYPYMVAENTEL